MSKKVLPFMQKTQYYIKKADQAEQNDRLLDALVYYRKANDIEPGNISVLTAMADIYTDLEYFEESNALIYEALRKNPKTDEDLSFLMGCNFMGMSYLANADKCFKQYKQNNPDGEYVEEIDDFFDFINKEPLINITNNVTEEEMNTFGKIYSARRYIVEKQEEKSIAIYKEILEGEPKNTTVLNDLSLAYYALGDIKKAIRCNLSVLKIEDDNIAAISNLIVFYKTEGDEFSGKKYTNKLIEAEINNPEDFQKAAYILAWAGYYEHAYQCAMDLLLFNPHDAYALHMAGVSAFNIGNYDEAIDYWLSIEKLQPSNDEAKYFIGVAKQAKHTKKQNKLEYVFEISESVLEERIKQINSAIELSIDDFKKLWLTDDAFKSKMVWALNNLEGDLYIEVVNTLFLLKEETAVTEIYRQLLNAKLPTNAKRFLVQTLQLAGKTPPFFVDVDGKVETIVRAEDIVVDKE